MRVTAGVYGIDPVLSNGPIARLWATPARNKYNFKLYGYVIMPDHVHLVLHPQTPIKLGLVIREIKSRTARRYFQEYSFDHKQEKHVFWQLRCYDHNCRTTETVIEKIYYCHNNPVVRGLVKHPGDWNYSSFNWMNGKYDVPIIMDEIKL
ncbi:MAG: transposase [Candidatus Zixiibacteriota bacterium]